MIGEMASILKDMLKPGGSFGDVLREILGRLLPLPKLDEAENGRPSYVEIVIDKSRLPSKGVLKQIALVINKERTTNDGTTIMAVGNNDDTAEIVINLDNNVTLRSVSAVRDYNTNSTKPNEDSGKTINVANPFDPVELTTAALNSSGLLDRVAADFYGISEYDSKSEKVKMTLTRNSAERPSSGIRQLRFSNRAKKAKSGAMRLTTKCRKSKSK